MARVPALHQRIRSRRAALGLRAFELAERVGVSASYISLIEKGAKVPEEDVAVRIARALDDDEGLYRAWAQATRVRLENVDALQRLKQVASSPRLSRALERGADLEEELEALQMEAGGVASALAAQDAPPGQARAPERVAGRVASPFDDLDIGTAFYARGESDAEAARTTSLSFHANALIARSEQARASDVPRTSAPEGAVVAVPVLAEGADPEAPAGVPVDRLHLDARLLPHDAEAQLFAYAVGAEAVARLRGAVAIGDYVVLRRSAALAPGRIHAVRLAGRVALSRVLFKRNALLLLPPEGSTQFEALDVDGEAGLRRLLVGHEVLTLRR